MAKVAKPPILAKNEESWQNGYLAHKANGGPVPDPIRFSYRHPEIKTAIRAETNDKCAYCESKVSHVHPGETDHIRPVSKRPELIVDWDNLTYVCTKCNHAKSDYDDDNEPLINPYTDEPEKHIVFLGPLSWPRPGDDHAFRTIRILDLNRTPLVERRKERIERLQPLLDKWAAMPEGPTKELVKQEIAEQGSNDKEFAALVRCFLRAVGS